MYVMFLMVFSVCEVKWGYVICVFSIFVVYLYLDVGIDVIEVLVMVFGFGDF